MRFDHNGDESVVDFDYSEEADPSEAIVVGAPKKAQKKRRMKEGTQEESKAAEVSPSNASKLSPAQFEAITYGLTILVAGIRAEVIKVFADPKDTSWATVATFRSCLLEKPKDDVVETSSA